MASRTRSESYREHATSNEMALTSAQPARPLALQVPTPERLLTAGLAALFIVNANRRLGRAI
jgi:hypothetical protein